jgi:hypothetical protein
VARMGEGRGVYRVLVGRPEGKRPLGRPRRRWEDNIKMDLSEQGSMGQTGLGWLWAGSSSGLLFDMLSDYQLFKGHPTPWNK